MGILSVLLNLAAGTFLLLYSVRMVQTGIQRASGPTIRHVLTRLGQSRPRAALTGINLAVLLQSSTAVAVLVSGFTASGFIPRASGLALLLGADFGSSLVAFLLSFRPDRLIPFLLVTGGALFLKSGSRGARHIGRILLGIALVLISLGMISTATLPLRESEITPVIIGYLGLDFVSAFLAGAVVTFLMHSSVASILMLATFASEGIMNEDVGLSMILGANLGGSLIAVWLTRNAPQEARRIPLGNSIFRAASSIAVLFLIRWTGLPDFVPGEQTGTRLLVFHVAFNLAMLLACFFLVGRMSLLLTRLVPDAPGDGDDSTGFLPPAGSQLRPSLVRKPDLALAAVTREILRMSQLVELVLRPVISLFDRGEEGDDATISRDCGARIDRIHRDIKLYVAEINRGTLTTGEAERGFELVTFAMNLKRICDIVTRDLTGLVAERRRRGVSFSEEGLRELEGIHGHCLDNMQLSLHVLVSEDIETARQLVAEKERMQKLERESRNHHMGRLRSGSEASIGTSDIHLETLRCLREINSLFASVAYPVLDRSGQLRKTRLRLQKTGDRTGDGVTGSAGHR